MKRWIAAMIATALCLFAVVAVVAAQEARLDHAATALGETDPEVLDAQEIDTMVRTEGTLLSGERRLSSAGRSVHHHLGANPRQDHSRSK